MDKVIGIITNKKVYMPIIYILIGIIIYSILSKVINKILERHSSSKGKDKRRGTIINLLKSIIKYLILIFVVLGVLNIYGINTTSIIASLGVFAAVIGLAFQDIIKDLLAGISIIFDNKYAVGDVVEINGFKGTVMELGLRVTKIKAFSGEIKCIGNSSFNEVTNFNLASADLFLKLDVAYNTDIDKLEKVLEGLRKKIIDIDDVIDYKLLGIDEFSSSSIVYMVDISCKAMTTLGVKRKVLRMVKEAFDKESISIPYTTVDINIRK